MTDERDEVAAGDADTINSTEGEQVHDPAYDPRLGEADWFLQNQIEFAERGLEQYVVLDIGGSHISGRLVGGYSYFEHMASLNRPSGDNAGSPGMVSIYEDFRDNFVAPGLDEDHYEPLGARKIYFVHLADARWLTAEGPSLPGNGTYWRGKLSAVDGFWMGSLRVEKN